MAIWTEWLAVIKKQRHHRNEIDRLGRNLARRDPQPDRRADKAVLIDDLDELYRLTVEANLSTPSGRVYVPSRFKQAIDRVRNGADPVQLVTRICRHASEGFDILLAHNRPDLTVEQLVVDAARPYHDLFGAQTRELSSQRLEEFPHADGTAQPLPGTVSSSAPVSSGSRGHKTTTVSQKDIDAGQVRIRIGPTKDRFPASPQNIRIVLRGRELTCWWNPRFNHDRERLGLIRVGTQAARDLLAAGEGLEVRFIEDSVHLD